MGRRHTGGRRQIPLTAAGELVDGDIEAQTAQVFRNLEAVLAAAGTSLADVVKTTLFAKDLNDFGRLNAVYERHFGTHKPARSTVEVAACHATCWSRSR